MKSVALSFFFFPLLKRDTCDGSLIFVATETSHFANSDMAKRKIKYFINQLMTSVPHRIKTISVVNGLKNRRNLSTDI